MASRFDSPDVRKAAERLQSSGFGDESTSS
jgi:hypothetical protein